jgi:hypothetical protein
MVNDRREISIGLPACNGECRLSDAINSVLALRHVLNRHTLSRLIIELVIAADPRIHIGRRVKHRLRGPKFPDFGAVRIGSDLEVWK